jgi:Signal transduction histidine kinase
MWNKFSLRIKIAILTAITLTLMCAGLTVISILNTEVFYEPISYVLDKKPIDGEAVGSSSGINHAEGIENVTTAQEIYLGSRKQFQVLSIVAAIGFVIVGAFLSYALAGRSLKSLKTFADRIEEIDESNLNGQVVLPPSDDEVAKLENSFNNMLEKLDRAFDNKKLFAANAAHELKTPLTSILTNIEVLQMEEEPSIGDYEEVIGITKENIERLTALVQDLLYFNSELNEDGFENLNTDELFNRILAELSDNVREKGIAVTLEGRSTIKGDKDLLERAFLNIIQNAVKYNKENGEIKIEISENLIAIEDTGIGIPDGSIPHIFDPFYCVDKSRSRKLGGNGLGLGIAKQIFDKHDMKITVSSTFGKGTKVFIRL